MKRLNSKMAAGVAIAVYALFLSHTAHARPVSYAGGFMVMQENDETGHTLSLDYTITSRLAISMYAKKESGGKEFNTIGPQLNYLVKRWNMPDGQANIYSMTGSGMTSYHGDKEASAWTGILADYETRRIFTSYELRGMYAGGLEKSVWQRARVGFAPYIANYDDLNSWFMLQLDHHPSKDDSVVVTPLMRFFYKTGLVEAGYSSNNHVMFNWVLQF